MNSINRSINDSIRIDTGMRGDCGEWSESKSKTPFFLSFDCFKNVVDLRRRKKREKGARRWSSLPFPSPCLINVNYEMFECAL